MVAAGGLGMTKDQGRGGLTGYLSKLIKQKQADLLRGDVEAAAAKEVVRRLLMSRSAYSRTSSISLTDVPTLRSERVSEFLRTLDVLARSGREAPLSLGAIIIPKKAVAEGLLVESTSIVWSVIVDQLAADWELAYQLPPYKWEEIVASAFDKAGFDEVVLTPRAGDKGRDVIAIKHGIGSVKIIDSVNAYKRGHLVTHDDVRGLLGALACEPDASKGILTTTSDFAPNIRKSAHFAQFMPTRLELMNGEQLQKWLSALANAKK
jgi:restriction system protein